MTFTFKSYDVFYQIDGTLDDSSNVILILNGIMMSTISWDAFKPAFTEQNVLLRVDMIDQGQTTKADHPYTQTLQVDMLKALLDHLQLKQVNIVGISYGASVALQFSIKYPNSVKRLVVANGVAKTSQWLKAIGHGWNEVAKTRNGLAYYNITIPYIYSAAFYDEHIDWMENRKKILIPIFSDPGFLDAMIRLTDSAETHDTTAHLKDIIVPTLIISGDQDYLTPVFEQVYLKNHIPNASHVIIPNCGHASMYEQPVLFSNLVLGFINTAHQTNVL